MAEQGDRLGHELSAAMLRLHNAVAARLELNVTEHKALDEILYGDSATPSALARRLGVSRAAVTKIVARLTCLGYVVGRAHRRDARSVVLLPTDAIRADVAELYAPLTRSMSAVLADLDQHQRLGVVIWMQGSIRALLSAAAMLEESDRPGSSPSSGHQFAEAVDRPVQQDRRQ